MDLAIFLLFAKPYHSALSAQAKPGLEGDAGLQQPWSTTALNIVYKVLFKTATNQFSNQMVANKIPVEFSDLHIQEEKRTFLSSITPQQRFLHVNIHLKFFSIIL